MRRSLRRGLAALSAIVGAGLLLAVRVHQARDSRPCLPATITTGERGPVGSTSSIGGNLLVANQGSSAVSLIDLATGVVAHIDVHGEPHDAVISPDGRWGLVSDFGPRRNNQFMGNTLTVIDIATKRVVRTIETGEHRGLHDVAFRPGLPTRAFVTSQTSREVLEVDVVSGAIVLVMETRGERSHLLAVTRDGRTLFTTNEGSSSVSRIDLATRAFAASFPATIDVEGIDVTADGKELWVGQNADSSVTVLDANTGARLARFPGFRFPNRIVMSPDGKRVAISDPGCGIVAVADPATRRITRVIRLPYSQVMVGEIALDGRTAFAAADARAVIAFDLETGVVRARFDVRRDPDGMGWGPRAAPDKQAAEKHLNNLKAQFATLRML